jgi:hypothetical protein
MATIVELTIGGYNVSWDTSTPIEQVLAAVKAARAAGAEPRKVWQGKPGGFQRRITPPKWDAQGGPCCPDHGSPLKFRDKIGKYLCQHTGADGKFDCRYGLTEAELAPFAAERFFQWAAKYGVKDLATARQAGLTISESATLAEWRAAARALAAAKKTA